MRPGKSVLLALLLSALFGSSERLAAALSNTTRTDSSGGVTVKVTSVEPKTKDGLSFQVVLDTHSVNLDAYDLKSIALLRDDAGKSYRPTSIENKGSGHHRQATISFAKIANRPKFIELVIRDIGGVKERRFRWNLE